MTFAPIAWAFLPMWQSLWTLVLSRRAPNPLPAHRRLDLYFKGYGPWYAFILLWSGLCLFAPHTRALVMGSFLVLGLIHLVLFSWSVLTTWALYRAAFGFSRWGASWRTLVFYLSVLASILLYYLLAGQLWPLMEAP